jgi:hypothetical protein
MAINSLASAIRDGAIQLWHDSDFDSEVHYSSSTDRNDLFFKRVTATSQPHMKLSTIWLDVSTIRGEMNSTVLKHEKEFIKPKMNWIKENFSNSNWIILRTGPTIDVAAWHAVLHWTLYADDCDIMAYKLTFDGKE